MQKQEALRGTIADLYGALTTSENGLAEAEAARRLVASGPNTFHKTHTSALRVLARQFKNSLVYLFLAAGIGSYVIGDVRDGTIILAILFLNTTLGFFQEYKSERVVEKLSRFITRRVLAMRDGEFTLIDESRVVSGDVLAVREGDVIPADMRLIGAEGLQLDESQLTGESIPVMKRANDPLFTGSIVGKGEGTGVVYATGDDTELGAIAKLSTETRKRTQYEESLRAFSSSLTRITLVGLALVFAAKFFVARSGESMLDLLFFIVVLAVGVVPEILPVIVTVTLSSGVLKLARRHVVVRRLSAMEDFGNINLLCTDKTGTLTENKMAVKRITAHDKKLFRLFACAAVTPLKSKKLRTQNSYDDAFLNYVSEREQREARRFNVVKEIPFDPEARRSRVLLLDMKRKTYFLLSIGAAESLPVVRDDAYERYLRAMREEGRQGLHHLAMAFKEVRYTKSFDVLKCERSLAFLGYASFEDPLRPSAKDTIQRARELGIKLKILTGDSREVAEYIGRQTGLLESGDTVYTGSELEQMTADEFKAAVGRSTVFARVSPTQKFGIINVLKESNVVGYQGDGINDAPALKLADVAIAVNTATDVAKENADIVLLNKSLEVIVNGVRYGRAIFVNINKYIRYTMSNNFGTFIGLSVLYLCSATLPILPVQILLNDFIGDVPLALVSTDRVEDGEVVRPEKHRMKELMFASLLLGVPTALFELLFFVLMKSQPLSVARTGFFLFLTLQALSVFYAVRTKKHLWKAKAPSLALDASLGAAFVASLAVVYLPQLGKWFSFVPLPLVVLGIIGILTLCNLIVVDYVKTWYYGREDRNSRR